MSATRVFGSGVAKERQVGIYDKRAGEEKRKQLHGAGRKALDVDMEEALFSWIVDLQDGNLRVSRKMLRQHARSLIPLEFCDTCVRVRV